MSGIFVFSEKSDLATQLLTPALELKASVGEPVVAIALNSADAETLATRGADKVLVVQGGNDRVESLCKAIYSLVDSASLLLIGGTLRGKHLAAWIAARLDAAMTTDARTLKIEGNRLVTTRMLYAGLAVCEEELALPAVVTIPGQAFPAAPPTSARAAVDQVAAEADERVSVIAVTPLATSGADITTARKLVSVGRGFRNRDDLALADDLAAALKAEVSCSRGVAEDEHWLPMDRYVGISGRTVKPDLYCAVGLSGQVQHMVAARESKVVVAINSDERAPIFKAADYGIVGDLYKILPLLTASIKS